MDFLLSEVDLVSNQSVVVELDRAANVKVMDASNFQRYRRGESRPCGQDRRVDQTRTLPKDNRVR